MIKNVLFDLDGTLTDPSEGITACIAYALEKLNIQCPPKDSLRKYIGPPLYQSFMELLGTDDKNEGRHAVSIYRERFSTVGLFENSPYEGIASALSRIQSRGMRMFVCTSKPQIFAERIIDHFGLNSYIIKTYGSALDGTNVEKDALMAHLLKSEMLKPEECMMIGDRIYDIEGARANSVRGYGVRYGFGTEDEFKNAEAVFDSPRDIEEFFTE